MIPVSPSGFVFIYLFIFLAGIFFFWITYDLMLKKRRSENLSRRIQCRLCGMEFENFDEEQNYDAGKNKDGLPLPCPRCGALTERTSHHSFL
ncbi:MAG: hypothetical protein ACK5NG_03605 [Chthoniobacterales bacterium]